MSHNKRNKNKEGRVGTRRTREHSKKAVSSGLQTSFRDPRRNAARATSHNASQDAQDVTDDSVPSNTITHAINGAEITSALRAQTGDFTCFNNYFS